MADVMFSIAEDARDVLHIKRERKSRTMMHVIFLFAAGILLAPFIFGFSMSIVHYINSGISSAMPNAPAADLCSLDLLLTFFIVFQAFIAVIAIGIVREGRSLKYILYAPILVLASLIIFEAGKRLSTLIVGGTPFSCASDSESVLMAALTFVKTLLGV